MPTLARFGSIVIRIFAGDHAPPHFHVVTPDHQALVRLSDLQVMAGTIDRRSLEQALEWAAANGEFLGAEWRRLNER